MKHNVGNLPKEEAIITTTDSKQLVNLGIEFTNNNVSVDCFVATDQFLVNNLFNIT